MTNPREDDVGEEANVSNNNVVGTIDQAALDELLDAGNANTDLFNDDLFGENNGTVDALGLNSNNDIFADDAEEDGDDDELFDQYQVAKGAFDADNEEIDIDTDESEEESPVGNDALKGELFRVDTLDQENDSEFLKKMAEQAGEWVNDLDFLERNGIFESDFFLLEISRLKTKFQYDYERGQNQVTQEDLKNRPLENRSHEELVKLAELYETYAVEFGEKYEYEWGRVLIEGSMRLRKKVYRDLVDKVKKHNQALTDEEKDLGDLQLSLVQRDWEVRGEGDASSDRMGQVYIDFCMLGEPATDNTESGILKSMELFDRAAGLTPPDLNDAKSPQTVKLWENRVLKALRLFEIQRKQGTASAIVDNHLKPCLLNIPAKLSRKNIILEQLWNIIMNIFDEVKKKLGQQTVSFRQFLLDLHQIFTDKLGNDALPMAVGDAFPIFPDVCKQLSILSLNHKDYKDYYKAQEYAIEELTCYLEMDEDEEDNVKVLEAWDRLFYCVRHIKTKASEQYFVLKDLQAEISIYNNHLLKDKIQEELKNIAGHREVRYIMKYSEQLARCSRIFFANQYDDLGSMFDESSLLEEILMNPNASAGPLEELFTELSVLSQYNTDFQFEQMKAKEFFKAKKIIEDNLNIQVKRIPSVSILKNHREF